MHKPIYIIDAFRTPIGKLYGMLSEQRADDLLLHLMAKLQERNSYFSPQDLSGFNVACTNQAGEDSRNIARRVLLLAGWPVHIPAKTINSLCASGMEVVLDLARQITLGEGDVYLAAATESMSRSPFVRLRKEDAEIDSLIGWRFINPKLYKHHHPYSMLETAEILARDYRISKAEQDLYAYNSRLKYEEAEKAGRFADEIIATKDKSAKFRTRDEQHRVLSPQLISKMPLVVKDGNSITSANTARVGDGAALILLASEEYVQKHQLQPLAQLVNWSSVAVHPNYMGVAPVTAVEQLLKKEGMSIEDVDRLELSEAFAVQNLACIQDLGIEAAKVNPYGGALSTGNPIAVGAMRLLIRLIHDMHKDKNLKQGIATTCAGLGLGTGILLKSI